MSYHDDEETYRHESYGVVCVTRRQGGPVSLFQSGLKHNHTIALSIQPASVKRHLNQDWVHSDNRPYIEVVMSEDQWARMVASIGMGSGTPCTIQHARTEGFKMMEPPPSDVGRGGTREEFTRELETMIEQRVEGLREAEQMLSDLMNKKGAPTKKELSALRSKLSAAANGMPNTASFILNQFEEAVEKNVSAAKSEFEAHVNATVRSAGLMASRLTEEGLADMKELESRLRGTTKEDSQNDEG